MIRILTLLAALISPAISSYAAADVGDKPDLPHMAAPYAGQQTRPIAALSEADVAALLDGQGWGFAKPAELNGYPGPRHVLDLADELALSEQQSADIQAIFDAMQAEARALGAQYVAAERALNDAFAGHAVSDAELATLTAEAARLRGELRLVHLRAHLETTPILTMPQRHRYMMARGYLGGGHGGSHGGQGHHHHDHGR